MVFSSVLDYSLIALTLFCVVWPYLYYLLGLAVASVYCKSSFVQKKVNRGVKRANKKLGVTQKLHELICKVDGSGKVEGVLFQVWEIAQKLNNYVWEFVKSETFQTYLKKACGIFGKQLKQVHAWGVAHVDKFEKQLREEEKIDNLLAPVDRLNESFLKLIQELLNGELIKRAVVSSMRSALAPVRSEESSIQTSSDSLDDILDSSSSTDDTEALRTFQEIQKTMDALQKITGKVSEALPDDCQDSEAVEQMVSELFKGNKKSKRKARKAHK